MSAVVILGILIGAGVFVVQSFNRGGTMNTEKTENGTMGSKSAAQATVSQEVETKMLVCGSMAIHNVQFLSEKFLFILRYIFTVMIKDHGLFTLIFDNTGTLKNAEGEKVFAIFYPDSRTVVVNLLHHFNEAYDEVTTNEECELGIRAMIWHSMIISIFHEINHSRSIATVVDRSEVEWVEEEEKQAIDFADAQIIELAKSIDIELPTPQEEPFFTRLVDEFRDVVKDEDAPLIKRQLHILDVDAVYSKTIENGEVLDVTSFKEYIRLQSGEKDDESWKTKEQVSTIINLDERPDLPDDQDVVAELDPGDTITAMMEAMSDSQMNSGEQEDAIPADFTAETTLQPSEGIVNSSDTLVDQTGQGFVGGTTAPLTPIVATLTPLTLSLDEQLNALKMVTVRLFNHLFTKCGFNPAAPMSFSNPGAVLEPVQINDIPGATALFIEMDTLSAMGQAMERNVPITGSVKGVLLKNGTLPAYWLYANSGGHKMKRAFIPQNPDKRYTDGPNIGQLKPMAQRVMMGYRVMWLYADYPGKTQNDQSITLAKCELGPEAAAGTDPYTYKPFGNK